jgi:hypothetical protein
MYLLKAVQALPELLGEAAEKVEIRCHDLRTPEGIRRNNELGIKNFPTIAINGEILFESFIPAEPELLDAVYARL